MTDIQIFSSKHRIKVGKVRRNTIYFSISRRLSTIIKIKNNLNL